VLIVPARATHDRVHRKGSRDVEILHSDLRRGWCLACAALRRRHRASSGSLLQHTARSRDACRGASRRPPRFRRWGLGRGAHAAATARRPRMR
jgi:hypothetical protein